MTPLEAALAYIAKGWNPTPIKPRDKKPVHTDWPDIVIDATTAPRHFRKPDLNIGVVLGPTSNGLTDIDLDCPEACAAAPYLLPQTHGLFGRASNRDSHWLYYCDLASDPAIGKAVFKFDDPTEPNKRLAKLLELRIGGAPGAKKGAQTVFPPSIHMETGEPIAWSNGHDPDPPTLPGAKLLARARHLAAAALLGRHWPRQTGMHNVARLIGGLLRRAGNDISEIALFIEAAARAGMDPDPKDRIRTARDAAEAFDTGKPTQGLPTLEKAFGKDIAGRLTEWLDLKPGAASRTTASVAAGPKPVIRLGVNLTITAEETEKAILASGLPLFRRDTILVQPVILKDGETRTGKLEPVSVPLMRSFMDRAADFEKFDSRAKDYIPAKPPAEIAELILDRTGQWPFPTANGMLMTPSMRADGSLILAPGYDAATGLCLVDPPPLPVIPDDPTMAQAKAALELLTDLLKGFPFAGADINENLSVALSGLITAVIRPALGRVPLHAITSPDIGSGKSYFVHCCAMLATGFRAPVITTGKDEQEMEKRLAAALIDGSPLILVDNVSGMLKSDFLCVAIEQPRIKIRPLGQTRTVEVEPVNTIYTTGNNLQIGGDLVRRTLMCRLDPKMENPWERNFATRPLALIKRNRGKYIAAVLTICRAHRLAAEPIDPPLASFEEWSDTVRSALTWLGCADPVITIAALRENDPERDEFKQIIVVWERFFALNSEVTAAGVTELANERDSTGAPVRPDLFRALMAAAGDRGGANVNARRLGNWLRVHHDKVLVKRVFRRGKSTNQGILWVLEESE